MTATSTAASSLPPVRTSCHVPLSLMTSISEETIALWLKLGALEKLEQAVLDGYGDQLCGKTSRIPQVNKFLKQVPLFQSKIREIHQSVSQGRLRDVQHLIDRKKLAFCRDHNGASPLHKAVIFGHQDVIEYLAKRYGGVIHIRDHQGRTALHYAAFLPDRGEIYQYLLALGADERAMDVYGRQPSYYLDGQNESTLRQLRDGSTLNGIRKIKPRYYGQVTTGQPFTNSNKSTVSKSQIREIISEGDVSALEDLVLQGQGDRLLGESSAIPKVQSFLNIVPMYMERIYDVHRAVMRDQLEHVAILLENRKLALARDQLGATPLHKAVWFGHYKIAHFISHHFQETLNAIDLEGRTALHYAAALKDSKNMYGILMEAGANKGIYDNKGKTADYYSQYPEHLNLEEVIKRCHKVNANYLANTASRIKGKSPVRQTPPPNNGNLSSSEENNGSSKENSQSNDSGNENELISMLQKDKFSKRLDINSANIRKWVNSKDVEKLTKAVMEGYGDKVVRVHTTDESEDKDEIASKITEMVERVNAIHTAVSSDDLNELQNYLDEKDFALAKDHMGMTPLHKAVLLRKTQIVGFLIEKFPETINAKNKNGLTALHYSAAMSRKDGQQLYKMLLQAGADPKIRDNHGRTPDYYKTHLITLPNKGMIKTRPVGGRGTETLNRYSKQGVLERMTTALQRGDVELLQDLVLEGHGKHLLGKTSWHEEVKNFLKELPAYLNSIQSFHEAIQKNDVDRVREHVSTNEKLMKARDDSGSMSFHLAALAESPEVLQYFAKNYPNLLNAKDATGKTSLHIVSQKGNQDLHKLLKQSGADAKILDLKGKTADFYLQNSKPGSALPKQNIHVSKVSPNTSSDSMYSNSSREDVPKTPGKILKRKSSKNLVNIRKSSIVGMNVERKGSQDILNNEIASTEPDEKNDEPGDENTDTNPSNQTDLENERKTVSRENEANNEPESDLKTDDEKVDDVLTEINEGSSEDIAEEGEAVDTNENVNESNHLEEEKEEVETAPEAVEDGVPEENTEDVDDPAEHLDEEEVVEPENEKPESRKNSDAPADATDGPADSTDGSADAEVYADSKETENDANNEDADAVDIDLLPDKDTEEAELPKVTEEDGNEGDNTADTEKDTGEAEDSLTQSEESNATVIENANNNNIENNDNSLENVESEDEDAPKTAPQRQSIDDVDGTLANIKNWEGKTVAEVGSGNVVDSMEINDEPTPASTEDAVDNDTETKQLDEENDNTEIKEDPLNDESEGDITDIKKEEVIENDQNDGDNQKVNEADEVTETADATEIRKSTDEEETEEKSTPNDNEDAVNENNEDVKELPEETVKEEDIEKDENKVENDENTNEQENDENTNEQSADICVPDTNKPSEVNEVEGKYGEIDKEDKHDEVDQDEKENNENNKEENEGNQREDEENENSTENLTNNNGSTSNNPATDAAHQTKDHLDELIEHWIKEGDLLRLEHVVLAGQGDRLIERTSDDKQVQDFLDLVPIYMAKIRAVHEAVAKGQLREVRSILTRKRFALSRDHVGASPLHLAVLHGHTDVSTYIISHFPETMDGPDNEGRTPLHYATALHDNGTLYRLLKAAGADENIEDKGGHSPKFYMHNPGTLTLTQLLEPYSLTE